MADEIQVTYTAPPLMTLMPQAPEDHQDVPDPVEGPYFIALKDGYHMVKMTHWGKAIVPVKEVPGLPEYKAASILWYPEQRLPQDMIAQVWGFFLQVFKDIQSEAMVYLTHKDGQYRVFIPPQKVTKVAVNATFDPSNVGDWQVVGTIHSHCDFGAHHSGTDMHDADKMDGLHITIGNVNAYKPTVAIMISVNKIKWDLKPEDIIEDGMPTEPKPHPVWWHRYVEKNVQTNTQYGVYGGHSNPPAKAPADRGTKAPSSTGGDGRNKKKSDKTSKAKSLKTVDIDEIESMGDVFDTLRAYKLWGEENTEEDLDMVQEYLTAQWETLASDLAAIGIWGELSATPIWKLIKNMSVVQIRGEMRDLVKEARKAMADTFYAEDTKSTDEREWIQESISHLHETDRDEIVALLGEG